MPVIGHFTISDAVLLIDSFDAAARWHICSGKGKHSDILGMLAGHLHAFICSGQAAGPACAAARAAYSLKTSTNVSWSDEDRKVITIMLARDIGSLRWGDDSYYWCGSLFGGGTIDPDETNEPEPWWDVRKRMLKMHRASMRE